MGDGRLVEGAVMTDDWWLDDAGDWRRTGDDAAVVCTLHAPSTRPGRLPRWWITWDRGGRETIVAACWDPRPVADGILAAIVAGELQEDRW